MLLPRLRAQALLLACLLLGLAGCAGDAGSGGGRLGVIKGRGSLTCGVDGKLPGFSFQNGDGAYAGIDVDICRAMAAALFNDPKKVEYRELTSSERFAALASGEVDLLSRNTTRTLSRDASGGNGLEFAPTIYYDGQGVMVPIASGVTNLKQLTGKSICVENGTTTELNLADRFRELGIAYTPVKYQNGDQTYGAYLQGRCAAVTSDRSQLAAKKSSFPDPEAHSLLPDVLSKEPLGPVTVNNDSGLGDALRWVVFATMQAEESGINSKNIKEKVAFAKANPNQADLRRFLGVEGDLGKQLGLPADFVPRVIASVGNYGEIFERNVGGGSKLKLDRGLNRSYREGGLIYSPPFR
jgi:general L-amino acid transport system substrate-binding protein